MKNSRKSVLCPIILLSLILLLSGCSESGSETSTAAEKATNIDYPGGYAALPGEGAEWNIQANLTRGGNLIQYGDYIFFADGSRSGDEYQNIIYIIDTISGDIEEFINLSEQFPHSLLYSAQMNIYDNKLFAYLDYTQSGSASETQIISIDLDSKEIQTVVSGQTIFNLYVFDSKVYFLGCDVEYTSETPFLIQRCDLDGSNLETVVKYEEYGNSPFFVIFDDLIYCAHDCLNTAYASFSAYTLDGEETSTTLTDLISESGSVPGGFLPYENSFYMINYYTNEISEWNQETNSLNLVYTAPTKGYGKFGSLSTANMDDQTLYTIEIEYLDEGLTVSNTLLQRCIRNDSDTFEVSQTLTVFSEESSGGYTRIQCLPFGSFLVVDEYADSGVNTTRYLYMIEESEVRQVLPVADSAE